jgi:hypothetical protein
MRPKTNDTNKPLNVSHSVCVDFAKMTVCRQGPGPGAYDLRPIFGHRNIVHQTSPSKTMSGYLTQKLASDTMLVPGPGTFFL